MVDRYGRWKCMSIVNRLLKPVRSLYYQYKKKLKYGFGITGGCSTQRRFFPVFPLYPHSGVEILYPSLFQSHSDEHGCLEPVIHQSVVMSVKFNIEMRI